MASSARVRRRRLQEGKPATALATVPAPHYGYLLACLLWLSIFTMLLSPSWQALVVLSVLYVAVCGGSIELLGQDTFARCPDKPLEAPPVNKNTTPESRPQRCCQQDQPDAQIARNRTGEMSSAALFLPGMADVTQAPPTGEGVLWEIRPSPGKGYGMFAKQRIARGTRVLVEEAAFSIEPPELVSGRHSFAETLSRIKAGVEGLTPAEQMEYLSCHDHHTADEPEEGRSLYIFRANAYTIPGGRWGMFLKMARINHSCRPNVANSWASNEYFGRKVAWALRDIEEGEEILITYVRLLQSTERRQHRLDQYGFRCECDVCQHSTPLDDGRRTKMGTLLEELDKIASADDPETTWWDHREHLHKAEELIQLLEEEGLADYLARAYHHAAVFAKEMGLVVEARNWASKELELHRFADDDSFSARATLGFLQGLGIG